LSKLGNLFWQYKQRLYHIQASRDAKLNLSFARFCIKKNTKGHWLRECSIYESKDEGFKIGGTRGHLEREKVIRWRGNTKECAYLARL